MLQGQQRPRLLWIGCSDSRVPANEIVGLPPGEIFVHRNVANLVVHSDLNALSAIEYATTVLEVRDIIVCGHYGCGGIAAALRPSRGRLLDHWIRHIRDIVHSNHDELAAIPDAACRERRLCELNVSAQVEHVRGSPVIGALRDIGIEVQVHGWIYDVGDGLLRELCEGPPAKRLQID